MEQYYRVHYKMAEFEIEVESSDKNYISQILEKYIDKADAPRPAPTREHKPEIKPPITTQPQNKKDLYDKNDKLNTAFFVSQIHESNNYATIESNILNNNKMLPRIFLVIHFAHKLGIDYLTTGEMSAVTNELGIKITTQNISGKVAKNIKYFTKKESIKRGGTGLYKLNRLGEQSYEKCLQGGNIT